ncbi:hypothetical protein BCEN4_740035 [Burkholderia cenocepacia]|uniref:hypothetical protein n=1 Tax=Burkholderia cenocepacia TaxID=95486 RepID=UPI00192C5BCE|nr:hypothetical protein [Burkholderia cenocepacia]CAD9227891.1 hypothetical protein BCEN4_740035 [Burkholderia cenocepacia]
MSNTTDHLMFSTKTLEALKKFADAVNSMSDERYIALMKSGGIEISKEDCKLRLNNREQ